LKKDFKSLPYRAVGNALEGLGFQEDLSTFDYLKEQSKIDSYLGWIRTGALKGIANLKTREAFQFLIEQIPVRDSSSLMVLL
jgi:hypothetical protein